MVKGTPAQILNGYKMHINRKVKYAEEFMEKFDKKFTPTVETKISHMIADLRDQSSRMEKRFNDELSALLDEEENGTLQTEVEAFATKTDKCVDDLEIFLEILRDKAVEATSPAVMANSANTPNLNTPQGAHAVTQKISDTLRPEKLQRSCNLEEFNDWSEKFQAWFKDNEKTLESKGRPFQRQLLHTVLDSRLVDDLKTNANVNDDTAIVGNGGCLDKIKGIFLKEFPLHVRRYQFFKCVQEQGQPYDDWWVKKKKMARNCDLDKVNMEDMMLLGLMTGIHDPKLKEEFLRVEDPTTEKLVKIAESWQSAEKNMKQLDQDDVTIQKTSNYKAEKERSWHRDRSPRDRSGSRFPPDYGESRYGNQNRPWIHPNCGSGKCKGRANCPAKGHKCKSCGKFGHFEKSCYSRSRSPSPGVRKPPAEAKRVRALKSSSRSTAMDDNEPIPMARMVFTPLPGGEPFKIWVFPDTGSSQSIISHDIAIKFGFEIDRNNKKVIKDAQYKKMDCTGSTSFHVEYEGKQTEVLALVSKSIKNECLLGWRALQRLKILHEDFPHTIKQSIVKATISIKKGEENMEKAAQGSKIENMEKAAQGSKIEKMEKADQASKKVSVPVNNVNLSQYKKRVDSMVTEYKDTVFNTSGPLKPMKGGPMHIHLKDRPRKPLHINAPRKVPYAYQEDAKKNLDEDEALGVIEKVEGPSEWCSPCSFVKKKGKKIRKILDVVVLNDEILRPTHPFPSPNDIVSTIPCEAKFFAVFDCLHGYWQIELDEESKPLTTFLTEFGRYRYCRAPMGLVSSGDEFCLRTDKALADLPGVMKLVDDILIYGKDLEEIIARIRNVFERCKEWGITLSRSKYQFGQQVKFAGYVISHGGVEPDPEMVEAIKNFKTPENITDLRSWFGLTNRFTEFAPDLKMAMEPLQELLSTKNAFIWLPEHQISMDKTKEILTDHKGPVRRHFDPSLPVSLFTDASRKGIGYILTQRDKKGALRLIKCGSRFITSAERNYAVVELECLAIQWAITKCRLYLAGTDFTVYTDHKPLLGIMNGRNLDAINNTRIQRLLATLLGYCYKVEWIPGKKQLIADALSRSPVSAPEEGEDTDVLIRNIFCRDEAPDLALHELSEAALSDAAYQEVIRAVQDRKDLQNLSDDHPGQWFKNQWDALSVEETYGLLLYHERIVVPRLARKKILELLHIQHTGITKTYQNARQLYFWHAMKNDIKNLVSSCDECTRLLPSQALEPKIVTMASRPFEKVSIDLGKQNGKEHLILADRYSGWPMVVPLRRLNTKAVIDILEDWFVDTGKPERLRSDGGPQFRSEFKAWLAALGIHHELSSAHHHESNGHAEATVRDMKHLLAKTKTWKEFRRALREYRNTPRYDRLSPAQWLFGRRQRTDAPALPQAYRRLSNEELESFEDRRREEMKVSTGKGLPPLEVGQLVIIQNPITRRWDSRGTITSKRERSRSYYVDIDGRQFLRNRRFLRPCLNQDLSHLTLAQPEVKPILAKSIQDVTTGHEDEVASEQVRRSSRRPKKTVRFGQTY